MTTTISTVQMNESTAANEITSMVGLYRLDSVAAVLIVLTALLEIVLTFLPGGYASADTASEWFALFQSNCFLGLRNLMLLNIVMTDLGIPMFFALYTAHRKAEPAFATRRERQSWLRARTSRRVPLSVYFSAALQR